MDATTTETAPKPSKLLSKYRPVPEDPRELHELVALFQGGNAVSGFLVHGVEINYAFDRQGQRLYGVVSVGGSGAIRFAESDGDEVEIVRAMAADLIGRRKGQIDPRHKPEAITSVQARQTPAERAEAAPEPTKRQHFGTWRDSPLYIPPYVGAVVRVHGKWGDEPYAGVVTAVHQTGRKRPDEVAVKILYPPGKEREQGRGFDSIPIYHPRSKGGPKPARYAVWGPLDVWRMDVESGGLNPPDAKQEA